MIDCGVDTQADGVFRSKGACYIAKENAGQLKAAIREAPVSVAIEADQFSFQFYKNGVIADDGECGSELDHGVTAVGYGTEDGMDYVLVRNSWGSGWGNGGYVKLQIQDGSAGACGVQEEPVFNRGVNKGN